jgi:hypothetical protein
MQEARSNILGEAIDIGFVPPITFYISGLLIGSCSWPPSEITWLGA